MESKEKQVLKKKQEKIAKQKEVSSSDECESENNFVKYIAPSLPTPPYLTDRHNETFGQSLNSPQPSGSEINSYRSNSLNESSGTSVIFFIILLFTFKNK